MRVKPEDRDYVKFAQLFNEAVKETTVRVPRHVMRQFFAHWVLLRQWNEKINLTRITKTKEAMSKHYLDSIALLPAIEGARTLLDVGSGAGFPGIPIAIAKEKLSVHLVESIVKKANFLKEALREMYLENARVFDKRVEELPGKATFDVVTGRAVANPPEFADLVKKHIAKDGKLALFLKDEEPPKLSGLKLAEEHVYVLPFGGEKRKIAVYTL